MIPPFQTLHYLEKVFFPGALPGVSLFKGRMIFDLALLKLGMLGVKLTTDPIN